MTNIEGLADSEASNEGREMMLLAKFTTLSRRAGFREKQWLQFRNYYICVKKGLYISKIYTRTMSL